MNERSQKLADRKMRWKTGTGSDRKIKEKAQDELMNSMRRGISNHNSWLDGSKKEDEKIHEEMKKQFSRIEKFLGYEPGSWSPYI